MRQSGQSWGLAGTRSWHSGDVQEPVFRGEGVGPCPVVAPGSTSPPSCRLFFLPEPLFLCKVFVFIRECLMHRAQVLWSLTASKYDSPASTTHSGILTSALNSLGPPSLPGLLSRMQAGGWALLLLPSCCCGPCVASEPGSAHAVTSLRVPLSLL